MNFCPQCGSKNAANCKFCTSCGNKLVEKNNDIENTVTEPIAQQARIEGNSSNIIPPQRFTITEFAQNIRNQYPKEYDDLSDSQLVNLWVKKYPNDQTKIIFSTVGQATEVKRDRIGMNKKETVEFCMNKHVSNKMVDIWLTIVLTLGLAVLIFPILIWLIYRYMKAKKRIENFKSQMYNNPSFFKNVHAAETFNSMVIDISGTSIEIPQLYIWFSKYSKKELVRILNKDN